MDISMFRNAKENARTHNEKGMTRLMLEPNHKTTSGFQKG